MHKPLNVEGSFSPFQILCLGLIFPIKRQTRKNNNPGDVRKEKEKEKGRERERERGHASLILQSFTEQSSLPLANFVGCTCEKSTDHALLLCSLN